jgi:hypothetical protein
MFRYLRLLRDELKSEAEEAAQVNGDASPSRKRKLQAPAVANINDAKEHREKLPHFVDRLYGRYREQKLRELRMEDQIHDRLTREIEEIEKGEWDEKVLHLSSSADPKSLKAPSKSPITPTALIATGGTDAAPRPTTISKPEPEASFPSPRPDNQDDGLAGKDVLNSRDPSPLPSSKVKEPPPSTEPAHSQQKGGSLAPPSPQRAPSNDIPTSQAASTVNPGQAQVPQLQPSQQPQMQPNQQPPQDNWISYQGGPSQQSQYSPNPNYPQFPSSPTPYQGQYPPFPPQHHGTFSGPQPTMPRLPSSHHNALPSSPHDPSRPASIAPPHPGQNLGRGPTSPSPHLDQLANAAEQQYRAPSGSPMLQQGAIGYGQPYQQFPPPPQQYRDGRPPSGNGVPPQWNTQYSPQQFPLPQQNYGYPPPPPGQRPYPADILHGQPRPYTSPYNTGRPLQPSSGTSTPRPLYSNHLPSTPISGRLPNRTGRGTFWSAQPSPSTPKAPLSPRQPAYEPISPDVVPTKSISKGSARQTPSTKRPGKGPQKGKLKGVPSQADSFSLDGAATSPKFRVKEESSTPRLFEDTGDTTADEGAPARRAQVPEISSPKRTQKRKRQSTPEPAIQPSVPPTHVSWTRNFPKISMPALERIGAHKNANMFAQPIRDKDAPGYTNIILLPQDLKSIKTSIMAGAKAGAAMVANMDMADTTAASVTLPISADIVPPKGIVNNVQLEKELSHMFANAIMFNPDPNRGFGKGFEVVTSVEGAPAGVNAVYDFDEDGVVKDTRAMFEDVEAIMGDLRSTEDRTGIGAGDKLVAEAEGDDESIVEDGADKPELDYGSVAKRRRRA